MKPGALVGLDRVTTDLETLEEQLKDRNEECEVLRSRLEDEKNKLLVLASSKYRRATGILGTWVSTLMLVGGIAQATGQSILLSTFIANAVLGMTYFTVLMILGFKKSS